MKIPGKPLLAIDRLFWLPHRLAEMLLTSFGTVNPNHSDQVVIIKFIGLGSIIRFAGLCEKYHIDKSKITLLTLASNRELCDLLGFSNAWFIRTDNVILFILDCMKQLSTIHSTLPKLIVDYERCSHAVGFYRTILTLFGKCKSVSFEIERSINNLQQTIYPADKITQEEIFIKGVDLMPTSPTPLQREIISIDRSKVLININSSNYLLARRYPIGAFAELITFLHRTYPEHQFYLTGNSDEVGYVESLVSKIPNTPAHNVAGKWNLEKLSNELSTCALLITCDSGPMHLGAYLGVATLTLWGPTQPAHFGYDETENLTHLSLKLSCSPCFRHPASQPAVACQGRIDCLKNMSPKVVADKAISLLSKTSLSRSVPSSFSKRVLKKNQFETSC
ncbi:hypothetical protein BH10BAC4_BH10BAC4_19750 [soil metagenome]